MLTLLTFDPAWDTGEWEWMPYHPSFVMLAGDVVCYGTEPIPDEIIGDGAGDEAGFIITGYHCKTMQYIAEAAGEYHTSYSTATMISFWRKRKTIKPKGYVPSLWSHPVPLP